MLINVFGVWLMAAQIAILEPNSRFAGTGCTIYFSSGGGFGETHIKKYVDDKTCDEVSEEINKQLTKGK